MIDLGHLAVLVLAAVSAVMLLLNALNLVDWLAWLVKSGARQWGSNLVEALSPIIFWLANTLLWLYVCAAAIGQVLGHG